MLLRSKFFLVLMPLAAVILSLFIGKYQADAATIVSLLLSKLNIGPGGDFSVNLETAIFQVRLPRILMALLVGMSLSVSGAVFQGVFRNPLVSDHILGVSNGASLGAAAAILWGASIAGVQLAAFISGMLAVGLTYSVSRIYKTTSTLTLVLSGIIVGGFFSALVSLLKSIADPLDKMPAIVFWLMGSFAKISSVDLKFAVPIMVSAVFVLWLVRWRLNILAVGEEDAKSLGMNTEVFRFGLVVLCTLATSSAVAVSGVIGWVGLVVPHVARILVGPDHKDLIPLSISLGGTYMVLMDDLARSLTTAEVSIGILTAIIGAPFFAYLLRKGTSWS
ncbi:MAG TPA: iron ABC transporter permease [Syntrophomonadaceae bacterium]|nr:iron ABC transporter permease [Syntrophomonadaceae bacterium]